MQDALFRMGLSVALKGPSAQIQGICPKPQEEFLVWKPYPVLECFGILGVGFWAFHSASKGWVTGSCS